jgi:hypothetical protein
MLTLWDIMRPKRAKPPTADRPERPAVAKAPTRTVPTPSVRPARPPRQSRQAPDSAQARYEEMTRVMLARHGVRVRKWRSGMSGVAWEVTYRDGSISRLIEAPRPKGPMSAAVFLHEIGHHAIGFRTYSPRCLEEYHAWKYAIEQMEAWGLNVTDRVHERMHDSLHYAVEKARRRGIKALPAELLPYVRPRAERRPAQSRA